VTPGYSTDREAGYVPKTIHSGMKIMNTTMYHESAYNQLNKSVQGATSPPLNQIKNGNIELEGQNKNKYGGIKLISTTSTAVKGREGMKYF
jgi:hypothetical protein